MLLSTQVHHCWKLGHVAPGDHAAGNITSIQDALDPAYNRTFQYDDLNRLTVANGGASLWGNGAYTYDAMGNLLTSSVGNRSLTAYPNGPNPRYSGVTENGVTRQISYDAAGNERVVGSETFEYNARNQLASSGALSYRYDGRGVRSVTTVQGGCPLSVQRAPSSFSAAGGTGRIEVTALPGCTWSASTTASWLTLGAPSGNALSFTAAANAGLTPRTATVTLGELSFTITQAGSNGRSNGGFDVDGNGGAELVAYGSRTGAVVVRTTNGLAAGAPATVETVADLWWKVVGSGDFDGDGDSDLLWRHGWSGEVAVHRMQNGTLDGVTSLYTEADRAWRVAAVGDVNGDGKADIISRNVATGAVVERLMATGMTVSPQTTLFTEADPAWRLVAAGDFNGDSLADLLWRNGRSGEVQVQFRSGSTFGVRSTAFTRADLAWVIAGVGDLDLDGKADIVMHDLRNGGLEIAYRQGAAATTLLRTEPDPLWTVAQMADYDANGMADVLWRNSRSGALRTDLLNGPAIVVSSSLPSSSDRALRFPNAVRASLVQAAPAADTLGDGRSDVIWRNGTNGDVAVWQMNGPTVPANEVILNVAAPGWEVRAAGDLNRDGTADLVWRNAGAGSVAFWYLNGKNLIGSDYLFLNDPVQKDWSVEAAGDLSGDGETDLVFRNVVNGTVRIMESLTRTSSHWNRDEYDISVGDLNWRLAGVGDFNGDRRADLLWWHRNTGQLSMWLMTKGGIAEAKVIYAVAAEWRPMRVGDFSGDGRADVLWRSFTAGTYSLWEMNGMTIAASAVLPAPNNDLYYSPQATSGDYNGDGYEDMLLRHPNGDVGTWEMASPANPTFRSFGNVAADWVVQRLEPRPNSTSGSSIAAATPSTLSDDQASQPAWTPIDAPPFWSVSPVRQVRVPRTTGPPFWAPAKGLTGPVPTPPIIPPGLGSSSTTAVADADSFDASPSAGPALIDTNAVTTSTRHSLYTPELTLLAEQGSPPARPPSPTNTSGSPASPSPRSTSPPPPSPTPSPTTSAPRCCKPTARPTSSGASNTSPTAACIPSAPEPPGINRCGFRGRNTMRWRRSGRTTCFGGIGMGGGGIRRRIRSDWTVG